MLKVLVKSLTNQFIAFSLVCLVITAIALIGFKQIWAAAFLMPSFYCSFVFVLCSIKSFLILKNNKEKFDVVFEKKKVSIKMLSKSVKIKPIESLIVLEMLRFSKIYEKENNFYYLNEDLFEDS